MNQDHLILVAKDLNIAVTQVAAAAKLLEEGATVPFIARYRKEATGTLDEVQIAKIRDDLERLKAIDDRRDAIKKSLSERNLLSADLEKSLDAADSLARLEDIYQPFKPKRRTRATAAKEKGLEALADFIFNNQEADFSEKALEFVSAEKGVANADEALAGARDIIAENISDNAEARGALRSYFEKESVLSSKVLTGKETEAAKYRDYFNWSENAQSAPSHRVLAIRRGEAEGMLIMRIVPEESGALEILRRMFVKSPSSPCGKQVEAAVEDSYKRLLSSTTETYMRLEVKKRADEEAVKIFAGNLRELLMSSPLGRKNVLAIDPGFRTGCKVVCLNRQGDLLHNDVIYIGQSDLREKEAETKIRGLCKMFEIEAVAIGNGTASRETEAFVKRLGLPSSIPIVMVNESGASIYSASEVAREEFPNFDITVRGAVSIGRRLMDPLAELVKIDPQSIGVGQYQHDVNQTLLKRTLDDVVISCVNSVGVEVNTASKQLLSYVSGLNSTTAANIIAYRNENGPFKSRKELMKVKGLGAKGFEQAAGFLRIRGGENPLDASAVHPERYSVVERMASDVGADVETLIKDASVRAKIDLNKYVDGELGMPTLKDIMQELGKPGRDPREKFEAFSFAEGVHSIEDLREGMRLPGIVTNVTAFGAFIDIGVHQDGLAHVSELADVFVRNPADVVKPQQRVSAYVLEVDMERRRIALSLKSNPQKRVKSAGEISGGARRSPSSRGSGFGRSSGSFGTPFGNSFGDAFGNAFGKSKK